MDTLRQDLQYTLRKLLRAPAFTAIAVVTLALGIGANSAIFSLVNAVVLRPLPFRDPDALVRLIPRDLSGEGDTFSPLNYRDIRDGSRSFSDLVALNAVTYNLTDTGEPERLSGGNVTANFFSMLGARAQIGRLFQKGDDEAAAARTVVLSDGFWHRRFGGDPSVVGRTIVLDGDVYTVIGVAPASFDYPEHAELWTPLVFDATMLNPLNRSMVYLEVIGRLQPGVSLDAARMELATIMHRLDQEYPAYNTGLTAFPRPLHQQIVGDVRTKLLVLFGAVGFVLLIACANVASLLLSRAATRESEIAIRTALGASRRRLVRQLLTESVVLASLGAGVGLLLASWAVALFVKFGPRDIPRLDQVHLDGTVVAFTVLVAIVTGVVFGLAPALAIARPDIERSLREGGRGGQMRPGSQRARTMLVVSELALALMLLIGAGLLIKSFYNLERVEPGFRPDHLLTFGLSLPEKKYANDTTQRAVTAALLERLRQVPGVRSAAEISFLPLTGANFTINFDVQGRPRRVPGEEQDAEIRSVSPEYFSTMGIPLVKGRTFTPEDRDDTPQVALINREFARLYFPGENPIGRRIDLGWGYNGVRQGGVVVGVVGDVKQSGLDHDVVPEFYMPFAQRPMSVVNVVLRTASDPEALATAARAAVREVDPELPLYRVRAMQEIVGASVAQPRFYTMLLVVFAGVALALAAVGTYGVISYGVVQRSHEIGIRLALGAQPADVQRLVVGQGARLAAGGLAIGIGAALLLGRVMSSLLFGVSASDPLTFVAVAIVLGGVALLASWIPARRASRLDPVRTLRAGGTV
jgi:putative ABC transport system permease protein